MSKTHCIFDILKGQNVATLPDHLHAYWKLETTIGGTHVFTTVDFEDQQVFATYIPSVKGPVKGIIILISDDDDPKLLQEKFEGLDAAQEWLDRTVSKILEDETELDLL